MWTPLEWAWSNAWRYAFTSGLSCGDLITVTEHGWYDFMTKHADHGPRCRAPPGTGGMRHHGRCDDAPRGRAFTGHDLEAMPDDGNRYELIDGALVVTPAPSRRHQVVSSRLQRALDAACPDDLLVLSAPIDFVIADDTTLQPDLVVVEVAVARDERAPLRPHLVVEILSPSTRLLDLHVKRERYASAGVPSYWIVDPGLADAEPSIVVFDLLDEQYVESAAAVGAATLTTTAPLHLTLAPTSLVG